MINKLAAALLCGATLISVPAIAQTAKPDFVTQQATDQWRASKLVGVNVYGTDNQKIGDISDVLIDQQGNAKAVVIGVGGFLGIGQKNVAVPFNALQWQAEGRSSTNSANTTSGAGGMSGGGAAPGAGSSTTAAAAERGYPDHAVLAMNKADLQNAPDFKFASDASSASSTAPSSAPMTGTAGNSGTAR